MSLSPLETMFVKVKGFQLEGDWAAARTAAAYDRWLAQVLCRRCWPRRPSSSCAQQLVLRGPSRPRVRRGGAQGPAGDITGNDYAAHTAAYKLPRALAMQRRGRACFDHEFYRNRSRDLPRDWEATQLWDHFVENGHFEGRTFRYLRWLPVTCRCSSHRSPMHLRMLARSASTAPTRCLRESAPGALQASPAMAVCARPGSTAKVRFATRLLLQRSYGPPAGRRSSTASWRQRPKLRGRLPRLPRRT